MRQHLRGSEKGAHGTPPAVVEGGVVWVALVPCDPRLPAGSIVARPAPAATAAATTTSTLEVHGASAVARAPIAAAIAVAAALALAWTKVAAERVVVLEQQGVCIETDGERDEDH
jgi:hypothetical protein